MARTQEFSREETLKKAMNLFWKKGYKATSMKDLVNEMGIQPGSIYNTFGDKHNLYIEAVKHYGDVVTTNAIGTLSREGSPRANLNEFFNDFIERPMDKKCIGCLVVNSVIELSPHDSEAEKVVKGILVKIENAFYQCLNMAKEMNEIPADKDIRALSKYFSSATHGLLVTGKSRASKNEIKDIVKIILSALD